ncbi:MAG: hypothetical protein OK439_04245 [Thaumarchaeota archaeon]|nr:hypothetical protein [Nitrososphaerota archaeon]
MSASKELVKIPNIIFIVTGIYFALVAGLQEGSTYTAVGAVLCFVAAGLAFEKDWFITAPWRVATAVFCIAVLVTQIAVNATAVNTSSVVVASTIVNGAFFLLVLGVLLSAAKEMITREKPEDQEEEPESKKKKLTYEI